MTSRDNNKQIFLPDFCNVRVIFTVVVLAQLLSFVLALGPHTAPGERWFQLSLISLFIQWVALSNCALLCLLRPRLQRFNDAIITTISLLLVAMLTLVISEASYMISRGIALEYLLPSSWHYEFLMRNLAISTIIAIVALRYFYVQHQLQQSIEARAQARIQALQARIRPHFLFNSMNTIASLTRTQPALAEEIVEDLADLFRVSLQVDESEIPLTDELQLCRRYLNIEKTRLGERLQVDWAVDEQIDLIRVPALSLQPLLENAIYHGIEPRIEGGVIRISSHLEAGRIYLSVSNPMPPSSAKSSRNSHHIALQNIRERLSGLYGDQGGLQIDRDEQQFMATLFIPAGLQERMA
jgi:two-component system sensor histidine kinase AlgZ